MPAAVTQSALREQLARPASRTVLGGFRPPESPFASWFGNVLVGLPGEDWPVNDDPDGAPLIPLCQINLTELPFCPENLADIAFLSVFIAQDRISKINNVPNGQHWCLRAYPDLDALVPLPKHTLPRGQGSIKPFPIRWEKIDEDFPCWDDLSHVDLPMEELERFKEQHENQDGTKFGGWPTTIQSEIYWAPGNNHPANPEFVFQIDSEEKANWMWGDCGVGYFGRGAGEHRDVWTLDWQCL